MLQEGQLGAFNLQVLLLTIVTGYGLKQTAKVIVDFLALRIMSRREEYKKDKFESTKASAVLSRQAATRLAFDPSRARTDPSPRHRPIPTPTPCPAGLPRGRGGGTARDKRQERPRR